MKRTISALILILFAVFCFGELAYGQTASPIDLVLLLDTSSVMSPSYDNVNNYITGAFLREFLRLGDTFHLIAFSGAPRLDVARRVTDLGDVETIIGRMLLQYPVERDVNVGAALSYAEQYIVSLPSRPKKIVLVSAAGTDTSNLVAAARRRLSSRNATLDFIEVVPGRPLANLPESGRPAAPARTTPATAQQPPAQGGRTDTGAPAAVTQGQRPETVQPPRRDGEIPFDGPQPPRQGDWFDPADTRVPGIETEQDPIHPPSDPFAPDTDTSAVSTETRPEFPAPVQLQEADGGFSLIDSLPWIIGIIIGILILLGLIILLSSRRLGSSPNRVMAEVSSGQKGKAAPARFADHSKDLASYAATAGSVRRTTPYDDRPVKNTPPVINPTGPLLLNLFVDEQNTAIGKRNIHSLKSGYSLTVGGGKSDGFLIFLVPLPANIGEIRRDGSSLTFIPRKAKYFPDIGSNHVRDCLNKTIRIVSDKNYELRFRFEMYEDPLVALNRMLNSIKVPG